METSLMFIQPEHFSLQNSKSIFMEASMNCVQIMKTFARILLQNSRPGLPYTEWVILLPGCFCVTSLAKNSAFENVVSCGVLSTIVKIVSFAVTLVIDTLVSPEAVGLQRPCLPNPGCCHAMVGILGHL